MAWGFLRNILQGDEKEYGGVFGFLRKNVAEPSFRPVARTANEVVALSQLVRGDERGASRTLSPGGGIASEGGVLQGKELENKPVFSDKENIKRVAGTGLEIGSNFVAPGFARGANLATKVGRGAGFGAGAGTVGSLGYQLAEGKGIDVKETVGGGLFGAVLGGAPPLVGNLKPVPKGHKRLDELTSYEGAPSRKRVEEYKKKIQEGKSIPKIKALYDSSGKLGIEDGKHRYQAYKELGYKTVPVQVLNKKPQTPKLSFIKDEAGAVGRNIREEAPLVPKNTQSLADSQPQYSEIPLKGEAYIRIENAQLDKLIRATTPEQVKKIIDKDLPAPLVDDLAPSLANVKDPNVIKNIIGNQAKKYVPDEINTTIPPQTLPEAVPELLQTSAVDKLTEAIGEARPQRQAIEKAYTQERARRIALSQSALEKNQGAGAFQKALKAQKGELLPDGPSIGNKLEQADVDELADAIRNKVNFDTYQKIGTWNGLQTIFRGKVPPESQLKLLEEAFGPNLIKELVKGNKTKTERLRDFITETINIPRALITTLDMSAPLRQSVVLTTTRPLQGLGAAKEAIKATFSRKNFENWLDDLYASPEYKAMRDNKLYIADPRRVTEGLSGKEEQFMSNIVQKLPWVGASERNYITYLNKMRVDTFESMRKSLVEKGADTPENLKALANFVNTATGRGNLGKLEKVSRELNNVFFSPRLVKSRFDFLNPVWYAKQPPEIRKQALKSFAGFVGVGLTTLAIMKAVGADVQTDPRSSDFGKIKFGNTRWDIWGGYQQWVRALTQFATGQRVTPESILNPASRYDTAVNFATGKLAPTPATAVRIAKGEDIFGESLTVGEEALRNTIPIYLQDMGDITKEFGPEGIFTVGVPAFFGVGTQTYKSTGNQDVSAIRAQEQTGTKIGSDFYTSLNKTLPDRDRFSKDINKAIAAQDPQEAQRLANEYNQKLIDGFKDWFKKYKGQQVPEELLEEFSRSTIKLNDRSIQGRVRTIQSNPVRYER